MSKYVSKQGVHTHTHTHMQKHTLHELDLNPAQCLFKLNDPS